MVHSGDRQFPRAGPEWRPKAAPSPVDRGKTGSKHHVIADGHGIPLTLSLTGGNRNDVTQLVLLLRGIPPVRRRRGRPCRCPEALHVGRGYDHDKYRRMAWATGVKLVVARRGIAHGSGLGTHRRVTEQTIGLPHWFRRLRIRDDIHEAFMTLAAVIIGWRRLTR